MSPYQQEQHTPSWNDSVQDMRASFESLFHLDDDQFAQIEAYAELLQKWNRQFNLVSRADIKRLSRRHLLDSLSGASLLERSDSAQPEIGLPGTGLDGSLDESLPGNNTVLDIGSGAGLPGCVLAIARPDLEFVLADRHSRKVRFLKQAITQLGLTNARAMEVHLTPSDSYAQDADQLNDAQTFEDNSLVGYLSAAKIDGFQNVVSRAVMPVLDLWQLCSGLIAPQGQLLAYTAARYNKNDQSGSSVSNPQLASQETDQIQDPAPKLDSLIDTSMGISKVSTYWVSLLANQPTLSEEEPLESGTQWHSLHSLRKGAQCA